MFDAFVNHIHRILAKAHRGNHRADVGFKERLSRKFTVTTRHDIEHFHNWINVSRECECCCDGFARVFHQRIGGGHIEFERIGYIRRNTAAREPGDIVERVLQTGEIMQITQGRGTIEPSVQIQCVHCSTASAKVDVFATDVDGTRRVAAMQRKALRGSRNRVLNQCARQTNAAISKVRCASRNQIIPKPSRDFAHA